MVTDIVTSSVANFWILFSTYEGNRIAIPDISLNTRGIFVRNVAYTMRNAPSKMYNPMSESESESLYDWAVP
jgi:hypothetical protein